MKIRRVPERRVAPGREGDLGIAAPYETAPIFDLQRPAIGVVRSSFPRERSVGFIRLFPGRQWADAQDGSASRKTFCHTLHQQKVLRSRQHVSTLGAALGID